MAAPQPYAAPTKEQLVGPAKDYTAQGGAPVHDYRADDLQGTGMLARSLDEPIGAPHGGDLPGDLGGASTDQAEVRTEPRGDLGSSIPDGLSAIRWVIEQALREGYGTEEVVDAVDEAIRTSEGAF